MSRLPQYYRDDLISAARVVLSRHPTLALQLTINEASGTVSDKRDGEVWAYVAPAYTAMTPEQWNGWREWPVRLPR